MNNVGHNVENVAPENPLALVERPDRAGGLHPFATAVVRAVMLENKMLSAMEKYNGTFDPVKHLYSLSLKGEALDWFHLLEPRMIDRFQTSREMFSQQFASSRAFQKSQKKAMMQPGSHKFDRREKRK